MNTELKQVIVMRKDLNMRKGKMIVQGAHASMKVILDMMSTEESTNIFGTEPMTIYRIGVSGPIRAWLQEKFTKVCVSVDSEAELIAIYEKAKQLNIPAALIADSGLTEFAGVPTNTCIAVGPWHCNEIDTITGHLKLL